MWASPTRTPPLYPDAVTLTASPSIPDLLARIDVSPGCSVKDSFSSIDLEPFGFGVAFEAQWIVRANPGPAARCLGPRWEVAREVAWEVAREVAWEVVSDRAGFAEWERSWRSESDPEDVLRGALAEDDAVTVLAARNADRVVAGGILNRAAGVVGISNVFWHSGTAETAWSGLLDITDALFGGSILVGYEEADVVQALAGYGFEPAGPLRVWVIEPS